MKSPTVRLGDIATYINGYAFKPSDWSDSGLPIIRIQNLTGNDYETNYYSGEYDKKYEVVNGDVLISWSASLGIYVWNKGTALLNQHIFKVVFDQLNVDKHYFVHAVSFLLSDMIKETHGSTMKHITKPRFDSTPFPYPSIEHQRQIAATLDSVTRVIDLCSGIMERLDLLVKARFVEMFGDPQVNSKALPTKKFIEVVKLQRGFDLPVTDRNSEGAVPVFGSNGILGYHDTAKASNGVITGRSGTIGKVFCIKGDFWPLNTTLFSVDTHGNNIVYLACLLQLFDLTKYVEGTGVPTLNRNKFHEEQIIDVDIEHQNQFAAFTAQIDQTKSAVRKVLTQAETLKKALMQEYFGP